MLSAIIIEDERPAMELLVQALSEIDSQVQVEAVLSSVAESIEYLNTGPKADIIFSDVQLPDGSSFEIFRNSDTRIPVVFITGYDEFMLNAFCYNGIDYLLKPINKNELEKALFKYRMLENHFASQYHPVKNMLRQMDDHKKTRLIVRRGMEHIALRLEDVVLFYTENKLVYVIDRQGKKYLGDKNLSDLEEELNGNTYFRANRQYIININFIRGFKTFEKVKLRVELSLPDLGHQIIISQENAPQFRQWMFNA